LARIFRIEQSEWTFNILQKIRIIIEDVSFIEGAKHKYKKHLNILLQFLVWKLVNSRTVNVLFFHSISYLKKNFWCTPITVLVCLILMIVYTYAGS
jgi:hypothetical protein